MLIILQGLHQISPKEKPYGSKDRKIFMCKCCIIFSPGQQTKAQKLFISWSASVILCPDLLIITDQGELGRAKHRITEADAALLQCRNVDQRAGGSHSQVMSEDHARAITRRETMVTINMGCRFIPAHTRFTACKHDLQSLQGVNIIYKLYSCKYPRPCRDPHLNWLPGTLAQANNEIAFRQSWAARWPGMEESVAKLG